MTIIMIVRLMMMMMIIIIIIVLIHNHARIISNSSKCLAYFIKWDLGGWA